jgi:hypothetical protein
MQGREIFMKQSGGSGSSSLLYSRLLEDVVTQ